MSDPDPGTRLERDSMGEMPVPADALYGASTQRAVLNFPISGRPFARGFIRALGSRHLYTPNTQDTSSRFVASALLYGSPVVVPVPDLERTDFALLIGTNLSF